MATSFDSIDWERMQGELFDDENEWYQREQALALDRTTVHVRPWPNIGQPSMSIGLGGRRAIVGAVVGSAPLGVLGFFGEFGLDAVLVGGAPAVWATFGALVAPSGRAKMAPHYPGSGSVALCIGARTHRSDGPGLWLDS